MEGLGRLFDLSPIITPADLNSGASTGNRVHMVNCSAVTFVVFITAGANVATIDLQEHDAATGGTSQDLDIVDRCFRKSEATLDGDETWTLITQVAASEVAMGQALQQMWAIHVDASELSDGFEWISVDIDDPGAAQVGCAIAILHDLNVQRGPAQLVQPNA
jgi:hypothetical protein